jgi:hypothetical protein
VTVFTAAPPAGVGEDKYDESAAAMIALQPAARKIPFFIVPHSILIRRSRGLALTVN